MKKIYQLFVPVLLAFISFVVFQSGYFKQKIKDPVNTININKIAKTGTDKYIQHNLDLGGQFKLIDMNGKEFSTEELKTDFRLVYFGYAKCPAVCPTVMAYVTDILTQLEKKDIKVFEDLTTLFISIDQKETFEQMKTFHTKFHKSLVMLTGSPEKIKEIAQKFRVYYDEDQEKYQIGERDLNHTSIIYFVDKDNKYITNFSTKDPSEKVISKIVSEYNKINNINLKNGA